MEIDKLKTSHRKQEQSNWTASIPREALFMLHQFGIQECRRTMEHELSIAELPQKKKVVKHCISRLKNLHRYGAGKRYFVPDDFVLGFTDDIIDDQHPSPDSNCTAYCCEIDIYEWAAENHGETFADFLEKNFKPADIVFQLIEKSGIVSFNNGSFSVSEWSIRVSPANAEDKNHTAIRKKLSEIMHEYVEVWKWKLMH
jgi:hypothetical protein